MHNPASALENEMPKFLWGFEIPTDHLISARSYNSHQKIYRAFKIVDFAIPADHRIKLKENEKKDKYLDLARELKKCGTWKWRLHQL